MSFDAPSAAMMLPVTSVARFMSMLDESLLEGTFVDEGLVIVENFAPHIFSGPNARKEWTRGFCTHAQGLSELAHGFGPAQDFLLTDDQVYFSLPTTWTGRVDGAFFLEEGGWAFLLQSGRAGWRIRYYGWAVTGFSLTGR